MKLIVGLGNPGDKYAKSRHNVGFMALDYFIHDKHWPDFHEAAKWQAEVSQQTGDYAAVLVKPQTFMNESGRTVSQVASFYKVQPSEIMVIYDELAIDFGAVRNREGGSSAGHNGVESIIAAIGDGFIRVRIGIANELTAKQDASDFVLNRFNKDEEAQLPHILEYVSDVAQVFIETGLVEPDTKKIQPKK